MSGLNDYASLVNRPQRAIYSLTALPDSIQSAGHQIPVQTGKGVIASGTGAGPAIRQAATAAAVSIFRWQNNDLLIVVSAGYVERRAMWAVIKVPDRTFATWWAYPARAVATPFALLGDSVILLPLIVVGMFFGSMR
jgi:hypothetical protein